jgi:hypothetical protein
VLRAHVTAIKGNAIRGFLTRPTQAWISAAANLFPSFFAMRSAVLPNHSTSPAKLHPGLSRPPTDSPHDPFACVPCLHSSTGSKFYPQPTGDAEKRVCLARPFCQHYACSQWVCGVAYLEWTGMTVWCTQPNKVYGSQDGKS